MSSLYLCFYNQSGAFDIDYISNDKHSSVLEQHCVLTVLHSVIYVTFLTHLRSFEVVLDRLHFGPQQGHEETVVFLPFDFIKHLSDHQSRSLKDFSLISFPPQRRWPFSVLPVFNNVWTVLNPILAVSAISLNVFSV